MLTFILKNKYHIWSQLRYLLSVFKKIQTESYDKYIIRYMKIDPIMIKFIAIKDIHTHINNRLYILDI
jgi:hypothetical protein